MDYQTIAECSLAGNLLTTEQALGVLQAPAEDLFDLLGAAFRVRRATFGTRVQFHVLMNAKSGFCPEDCGYCSQSSMSTTEIDRYPLRSMDEMLQAARKAHRAGAHRFCLVISARGATTPEIERIVAAVEAIKAEVPIEVCCSLGLLTLEKAQQLKAAGVDRVNHNLNTSARYYPAICSTHSFADRVATVEAAQAARLATCSGVLAGMGETDHDLIEVASVLRGLAVDSVPVNFLHPVAGTPLADVKDLTPWRCLKILCLFRFMLPKTEIRVAGGREVNLRSLQPLALYPGNSLFIEGYLTTPGQAAADAIRMVQDLGFEVGDPVPMNAP
ncbi:MAG: biotin synthase BioB [Nitrospirae bacterium]|nr:biotin synthase BioB [Nitrospirota bacterium]